MIAESVFISTPDHVTLEFELAGLGSRFCAFLIDTLLIFLMIILVGVATLLTGVASARFLAGFWKGTAGWVGSWSVALLIFFFFLITWGYYVFFEGLRRGSTPGKKRLGICVIREDGLPIGFREAALRNLVRIADMLPPPCYLLGGLVMYFDRLGRRLGDMVAGTFVVVEKFEIASHSAAAAAWAARMEQGASRKGVILPQGNITPAQLALIEQFMARRHTLSLDRREALVLQIAEPLLALIGADRDAIAKSPDRASHCEQLLREILEKAQAKGPHQTAPPIKTTQPSLF